MMHERIGEFSARCGATAWFTTVEPEKVTCMRCLAPRRHFGALVNTWHGLTRRALCSPYRGGLALTVVVHEITCPRCLDTLTPEERPRP